MQETTVTMGSVADYQSSTVVRGQRVTRRIGQTLGFWLGALGCQAAFAEDISGTYVGTGNNSAFFLQIVETNEGHLTGRYEDVFLRPSGKIEDRNAAVTGATKGRMVVITITSPGIMAGNVTTSGTIEGPILHLTGGGNGISLTLNLLKSDEVDFRARVAALTEKGRNIDRLHALQETITRNTQAATELLTNLRKLTDQLRAFTTKATSLLPKFAPAEQRYRDITRRMQIAYARERSLYGDGQASVVRGQISVAINQISIEGTQFHNSVQAAYEEMGVAAGQLESASKNASKFCQKADQFTASAAAVVGPEAKKALCVEFFGAEEKFNKKRSELGAAFVQTEVVWKVEGLAQDKIVNAADAAVQQ